MSASDAFLAKIEAYLTETGMTPTAFGHSSVGDGNFVRDLRDGRMPSLRLVDKVDAFIAANPPKISAEAAE